MSRLLWIGAGFLVLILILYQLWVLSHLVWWVSHNPSTSAFMDERLGVREGERAKLWEVGVLVRSRPFGGIRVGRK